MSKKEESQSSVLSNHDDRDLSAIEWGIANQVIFQSLNSITLKDFPQFIKTMVYHVAKSYKLSKYLTFNIVSTIGWRERDKFYQPYQIWLLSEIEDHQVNQALVPQEEINRVLSSFDIKQYAINCGAQLKQVAVEEVRQSNLLRLTDGRRIFVTHMASSNQPTSDQQKQAEELLATMATDTSQLDIPFMVAQEIEELSNLLCLEEDNSYSN
ncbi:hypothetical protein M0R45_002352 [Rubus argutus]|uniref:Uncharacterized protein n=1 Tax=Rubus argutus TaxID=59490 RepID=A0AAW1VCK2_RUBAR